MQKRQTSGPSAGRKERTGIDRLYKRVGVKKVSFYYQHPDGKSETLASAAVGDRAAIAKAEQLAARGALDIQQGVVVAGSVAEFIDRFEDEFAPTHYRDQSKDGLAVRKSAYSNLKKFFGAMSPVALRTVHGYQYLDARAKGGAPAKANKEMSQMSTICHYMVRTGVIEANPFTDMMQNRTERKVRSTQRSQVVRFYLWCRTQAVGYQVLGCAAMFAYLTGFRPSEVRPYHASGLTDAGVRVAGAKRKKGEQEVVKLREWSPRLRMVVKRARQLHPAHRMYLFGNATGAPYTRSGWGAQWTDAMFEWIASFDDEVAVALVARKAREAMYRANKQAGMPVPKTEDYKITTHPAYFALKDVRPAAITTKLEQRNVDALDFAAHANPATTYKNYDRRKVKRASATE